MPVILLAIAAIYLVSRQTPSGIGSAKTNAGKSALNRVQADKNSVAKSEKNSKDKETYSVLKSKFKQGDVFGALGYMAVNYGEEIISDVGDSLGGMLTDSEGWERGIDQGLDNAEKVKDAVVSGAESVWGTVKGWF